MLNPRSGGSEVISVIVEGGPSGSKGRWIKNTLKSSGLSVAFSDGSVAGSSRGEGERGAKDS